MPLIHLHNEIVSHRELGAESWSTYLAFFVDESTRMIHADTIQVYYNAKRHFESRRQRVGQQRISYNKAPFCVLQELKILEDVIPAQSRDTVPYSTLGNSVFVGEQTSMLIRTTRRRPESSTGKTRSTREVSSWES
jgi:hypothetical protein